MNITGPKASDRPLQAQGAFKSPNQIPPRNESMAGRTISDIDAPYACHGRRRAKGRNGFPSMLMRQINEGELVGGKPQSESPLPGTKTGTPQKGQNSLKVSTASTETKPTESQPDRLMEKIAEENNLMTAFQRVLKNNGKPGIDNITVADFFSVLQEEIQRIRRELLSGTYSPSPVKRREISKSGSTKKRILGIPTVRDRVVQQAILQILTPLIDPTFSESSYGFRPGRNAAQAVRKGSEIVSGGRRIVVDIDLSKFFDTVNHDILIHFLNWYTSNKYLCKLVRSFLTAGIMHEHPSLKGEFQFLPSTTGTPQGGPLSPLLANLVLHKLDKELEKRGLPFVRYADDFMIFVKSLRAGQRVMQSIQQFLEKKLKLTVNKEKSAVDYVANRKFLGYRILNDGRISIHPESLKRIKDQIRKYTSRNGSKPLQEVISELKRRICGSVAHFRAAELKGHLRSIDAWVRRKLRCLILQRLRQGKETGTPINGSCQLPRLARLVAESRKGVWHLSKSPQVSGILTNKWFHEMQLPNFSHHHEKAKRRMRSMELIHGVV